jgi:nucleoside-diphosphate-sugar epimerase
MINEILGKDIKPVFGPPRPGDVKHSLADITKAREHLGYEPVVNFRQGLELTIKWYQKQEGYL